MKTRKIVVALGLVLVLQALFALSLVSAQQLLCRGTCPVSRARCSRHRTPLGTLMSVRAEVVRHDGRDGTCSGWGNDRTPGWARVEREARLPSLPDRLVGYGIWVAVVARVLGDRRFQAGAVTRVLGAYALGSLVKNNQARPMRRAVAWYNVKGRIHHVGVLHDARRQAKPDKR